MTNRNEPIKTLPPYIHSGRSVGKRCWGTVAALVPVFLIAAFLGRTELFRVLLLSLVSAVAFEFLGEKLFRKKDRIQNGESVLTAVLFSLLMPSKCPSEIIIFGNFLAVFIGKELFGGMGSYLFHPVLIARVFLQMSFSKILSAEPMLLVGDDREWIFGAFLLSGLIQRSQKKNYWEVPLLYMFVCFSGAALLRAEANPWALFNGVFLTAFFLLEDPVAMPMTKKGTMVFVLGAALLSLLAGRKGFSISVAGCAILLMNLLTPWIDIWIRPVSRGTKTGLKTVSVS